MNLSTAFSVLKAHFHTHSAVAAFLGMTRDHYRALRNGRVNIPPRTADYICLKAAQLESDRVPSGSARPLCPDSRTLEDA